MCQLPATDIGTRSCRTKFAVPNFRLETPAPDVGAFCRAKIRLELAAECASYLERRIGTITQPQAFVTDEKIFAVPKNVEDIEDCYFYHTMEIPGYGLVEGKDWDLRAGVDDYLGKVDFADRRVLEIGPASGFLTFEMEKRGADVVSVEVTDEHGWDFVPYPDARLKEVFGPRAIVMQQFKNSY